MGTIISSVLYLIPLVLYAVNFSDIIPVTGRVTAIFVIVFVVWDIVTTILIYRRDKLSKKGKHDKITFKKPLEYYDTLVKLILFSTSFLILTVMLIYLIGKGESPHSLPVALWVFNVIFIIMLCRIFLTYSSKMALIFNSAVSWIHKNVIRGKARIVEIRYVDDEGELLKKAVDLSQPDKELILSTFNKKAELYFENELELEYKGYAIYIYTSREKSIIIYPYENDKQMFMIDKHYWRTKIDEDEADILMKIFDRF